LAGKYNTNIAGETTVTAFSLDRLNYNHLVLYALSSHDVIVHVDLGVSFGGTTKWISTSQFAVPAGTGDGEGQELPIPVAAELLRVRVENPGAADTTEFYLAAYRATAGGRVSIHKSTKTLWEDEVLVASASDIFSPVLDLTNAMGAQLTIRVANGATGPTLAPAVWVQGSSDGVVFGDFLACGEMNVAGKLNLGGTGVNQRSFPSANNAITEQSVLLPYSIKFARLRAGKNTGQNVTISAFANTANF
jgi:hypothetical protein